MKPNQGSKGKGQSNVKEDETQVNRDDALIIKDAESAVDLNQSDTADEPLGTITHKAPEAPPLSELPHEANGNGFDEKRLTMNQRKLRPAKSFIRAVLWGECNEFLRELDLSDHPSDQEDADVAAATNGVNQSPEQMGSLHTPSFYRAMIVRTTEKGIPKIMYDT